MLIYVLNRFIICRISGYEEGNIIVILFFDCFDIVKDNCISVSVYNLEWWII